MGYPAPASRRISNAGREATISAVIPPTAAAAQTRSPQKTPAATSIAAHRPRNIVDLTISITDGPGIATITLAIPTNAIRCEVTPNS